MLLKAIPGVSKIFLGFLGSHVESFIFPFSFGTSTIRKYFENILFSSTPLYYPSLQKVLIKFGKVSDSSGARAIVTTAEMALKHSSWNVIYIRISGDQFRALMPILEIQPKSGGKTPG